MRWSVVLTALSLGAVACSDTAISPAAVEVRPREQPAPLYAAVQGAAIPGQYIVAINDDVPNAVGLAHALGKSHAFSVITAWDVGFRFFAAKLPPGIVEVLRRDPRVKYVAEDQLMSLDDTYPARSWGLDRIDQRNRPLNSTYQDYLGGNTPLTPSHIYIIDSGIRYSHVDFEGRATPGFDADSAFNPRGTPDFAVDCFGHGTHVAGTAGGRTFGVAKRALIVGVRVFGCGPTTSTARVLAGINWVTANAVRPAVANMSFGSPADVSVDNAVNALLAAGVTVVVSAGNNNANACNSSPARVPGVITVGATTETDARAGFSNFGTCLDIFAPGTNIISAGILSDVDTLIDNGTSMAAPHVTGTVALLQSLPGNGPFGPAFFASRLNDQSTTGVVTNLGTGSPNRLLQSITPFNTYAEPPGSVGCGQSVTYHILGYGGVGPYSDIRNFVFLHGWDGPYLIGTTEFVTLTAGFDADMIELDPHMRDARGVDGMNTLFIMLCG